MKRFLAYVFFYLSLLFTGQAQILTPLESYPKSTNSYQRSRLSAVGDTLDLPFFDDFANQPNGPANRLYWQRGGGAFINNQFGLNPPSAGVATLEGIRGNGLPYNTITAYGPTDTLTSKPLNLQNFRPLTDSVYLSFYWQAGGLAGSPDTYSGTRPVFLALEFKQANGTWQGPRVSCHGPNGRYSLELDRSSRRSLFRSYSVTPVLTVEGRSMSL